MEELGYFADDERQQVARRSARLIAAGVITGLLAAAMFVAIALMGLQLIRYSGGSERFGILLIFGGMIAGAVVMAACSVGLLLRRRWSRPLTMAVQWNWLFVGAAIVSVNSPYFIRRLGWLSSSPSRLFWNYIVPMGITGALLVGFPIVLLVLLGRQDVRHALAVYDLRPRWSDRWTVGMLTSIGIVMVSLVVSLFILVDPFDEGWEVARAGLGISLWVAAGLDAISLVFMLRRRPAELWLAAASTLVLGAVLLAAIASTDHYGFARYGELWAFFGLMLTIRLIVIITQRQRRHEADLPVAAAVSTR